jgi:hypothetical protein
MPRVENIGENVKAWCREHGRLASSTYDLCAGCYAAVGKQPHVFDAQLDPRVPGEPRGVDGWGGNVEHPCYTYWPAFCAVCGVRLTLADDRRSLDCCTTRAGAIASHTARVRVRHPAAK